MSSTSFPSVIRCSRITLVSPVLGLVRPSAGFRALGSYLIESSLPESYAKRIVHLRYNCPVQGMRLCSEAPVQTRLSTRAKSAGLCRCVRESHSAQPKVITAAIVPADADDADVRLCIRETKVSVWKMFPAFDLNATPTKQPSCATVLFLPECGHPASL